jgi:hypothetical protein
MRRWPGRSRHLDEEGTMAKGPRGEVRPADVTGCTVVVARLSVGDATEALKRPSGRVRSAHMGAKACVAKLPPGKREEIARKAAGARWS